MADNNLNKPAQNFDKLGKGSCIISKFCYDCRIQLGKMKHIYDQESESYVYHYS